MLARALSHFAIEPQQRGALLLGYAATDIDALRSGTWRLAATLGALFDQREADVQVPVNAGAAIRA